MKQLTINARDVIGATVEKIGVNIEVVREPGKRARVYYKGRRVSLAWFDKNVAHISKGNIKLQPTEVVKFAIFNVISQGITRAEFLTLAEQVRPRCGGFDFDKALETALRCFNKAGVFWGCPGATPSCIRKCYDARSQNGRRAKTIKPSRVRNFIFTCAPEFRELMTLYFVLRFNTDKALQTTGTRLDFRIHEGGELYNQSYTDEIIGITFLLKLMFPERLKSYTYTKSFKYLEKYRNASGRGHVFDSWITVNASLWDDSPAEAVQYVAETGMSLYTVKDADGIDALRASGRDDIYFCECTACGRCEQCARDGVKVVAVH